MNNARVISMEMQPANGKMKISYPDGYNQDIIAEIHKNFNRARKMVSKTAQRFKGSDSRDTAYKVWRFLRERIKYEKDPEAIQMIRLPNRLIADGQGDCKSYSLFAAAILSALGMPVAFRYASYGSSPIPTHVYVVTRDEEGNEIIVDGVWSEFDSEKPYTFKKDRFMKIATLSGIGSRASRRAKRATRKAARQEKRSTRKAARKEKRAARAEKRGGAKGVKRIALAPARGAFLTIVRLNVRSAATNLQKAIAKNPERTKKMWNKLGGNFNKLKKAVDTGAKKKRLLGFDDPEVINGIGAAGAASALAAAAPIIVVVAKFLKGEGIQDGDTEAALQEGLDALEQTGQSELPNNLAELDIEDPEPGSGYSSGGGGIDNKFLLIGGAALLGGIFLLSKKRK